MAVAAMLALLLASTAVASAGSRVAVDPSDLVLNGSARLYGSLVRLTGTEDWNSAAAAWVAHRVRVIDGFDVAIRLRITPAHPIQTIDDWAYGDGGALVIQDDPRGAAAVGGSGGNLGYGDPSLGAGGEGTGIAKSLAIEFDTVQNGEGTTEEGAFPGAQEPNGNHLSIQSRGAEVNSGSPRYSLATTTQIPNLSNGQVHTLRVHYVPGTLLVYMDNSTVPRLRIAIDIERLLRLNDGAAWLGLTAGTGDAAENHDILSLEYATGGTGLPNTATESDPGSAAPQSPDAVLWKLVVAALALAGLGACLRRTDPGWTARRSL